MPVTTPVEPTAAIAVLPLVQKPPVGVPLSVMDEPTHTVPGPEMVAPAETVMVRVTKLLPTV